MPLIARPGILEIDPYIPGDHALPGSAPVYRMASNEGALGASPLALEAYRAASGELHRYPDGSVLALREAIGKAFDLEPQRIVCGAGSDELLQLLARAYAGPGDEVLYSQHGFLVYPIAAKSVGARPVPVPEKDLRADLDGFVALINERTKICFLANPNNPTGSYVTKAEMERFCDRLPDHVLLVIDAAYAEYADGEGYADGMELARHRPNVVVTRTFSKIFGLAALRLGWAYCPPGVADILNRIRGPFNVPSPAQAAGIAALGDKRHLAAAKAHNDRWRTWLFDRVSKAGLKPYPSLGNFLLIEFSRDPRKNADAAAEFLKTRRILPRKMGAYGLESCLRITIAEEGAILAIADALDQFMGKERVRS